jgi:hypothetical protein
LKALFLFVLILNSSLGFAYDDSFYGKYVGINERKENCELIIKKEGQPGFLYAAVYLNIRNSLPEDFAYLNTKTVELQSKSFTSRMEYFANIRMNLHTINFSMSGDHELLVVLATMSERKHLSWGSYHRVRSFKCEHLKKIL